MNWFKRTLNKLIFKDEVEDEYDYYEEDEWQEPIYEKKEQNRAKFRFPLIPDEELQASDQTPHQPKSYNDFISNIEPQHHKNSLVYDVEVSRIHELLEMRKQNKKKTTSVSYDITSRRNERLIEKTIKREPIQKEQPIVKEKSQPQPSRKRFIPTDVPSPVYGFQKRKPINALYTHTQEQTEQKFEMNTEKETSLEQSKEIIIASEEVASTTVVEEIDKKLEQVKEEVEQFIHQSKEEFSITIEEARKTKENDEEKLVQNDGDVHLLVDKEKEFSNEPLILTEPIAEEVHIIENNHGKAIEVIDDLESVETSEVNKQFALGYRENVEPTVESSLLQANTLLEAEHDEDLQEQIEKEQNEPLNLHEDRACETGEQIEETQHTVDKDEFNSMNEVESINHSNFQNEYETGDSLKEDEANGLQQISESLRLESVLNEAQLSNNQTRIEDLLNVQKEVEEPLSDDIQMELSNHSEIHEPALEEELSNESAPIKQEQPKTKPIPFNVIMLKSDKEKLAKKQQLQKKETNDLKESQPIEIPEQTEKNQIEYKYLKPPLEYLAPPEESTEDREWMERQAETLVEALSYFQVNANVESIMQGPAVTQFEITVSHGTKVSKIRNLADDLKLALAAKDIRIQAPIPGKNTIGIEIPNRISRAVRLSEVVNSESFLQSESPLEAALGLDLTGKPVTIDLRKMPHGLIAGATGSGKSVCINSILVSLLLKAEPSELKLMLIDPKVVELAPFNHIPHLVSPVITDVKAATAALKWAVDEMERRYQLFAHAGVRDLPRYNKLVEQEGKNSLKLPYILIVIDELADLMMMAPQDVEESICRIAQKARACGIHLIVATQRPSVDVITGLIKSNIPTRIAFSVSSQIDSRTILDSQGAERLLGRGDMLYLGNGMTDPIRLQGTYVTDDEIEEIIEHVKEQGEPEYLFEQEELLKKVEMIEEQDELFEDVCRFVYEQGSASTSSIQRKYHIGYNRAARLIEMLESYGFVSEQKGSKPREVYITESDLAELFD
ncbi:DNA translocase FtsK [Ureibacillus sp. FSL K6-2830]|uniref:DNA translocase FtsK n=1 Tax=Ureibacillus sp. FSL K6-2830 TaxID=2954610 RepID=UPI0030F76CA0